MLHIHGCVAIYDPRSAARLQTLRGACGVFTAVWYEARWRMFCTMNESWVLAFHFVQEREEQGEVEERRTTKPLIRSYCPPTGKTLSYFLCRDRTEIVLTFTDNAIEMHKVVEMDVDTADTVDGDAASVERAIEASSTGNTLKRTSKSPFTSTLVSHDGRLAATANNVAEIQIWVIR